MADAKAVTALIADAYSGYVPRLGRNPQPMDDDYFALIRAGEVFVIQADSRIDAAMVIQETSDRALLVRTIAVAPDRQGLGIGTKLIAYAETVADSRGINLMRLYTNEVMDGTVRLYARLGFTETHRTGDEGRQVIYMAKERPAGRTDWYGIIVTDPDVCFGKPRIAGTRHYLDFLLGMIEDGCSIDQVLEEYPTLTREQLQAMLGFVRDLVAGKRNALKGEQKNG